MAKPAINTEALGRAVAKQFNMTITQGVDIANFMVDTIEQNVLDGTTVRLTGFGQLEPRARSARTVHNVATGGKSEVPARTAVIFKPAKGMKERLVATA